MDISIGPMWAVAYTNNLTNKIEVYSKLFEKREEAQAVADDLRGVVQTVFSAKNSCLKVFSCRSNSLY
jgi:hypothetical protein